MDIRQTALITFDYVADISGIRLVPDRLLHPHTPDVTTLEIQGYRQIDSFSCGAIAALMLVHTWHREVPWRFVYDHCRPNRENGTPTTSLVQALRKCGVGVSVRNKMRWKDIDDAIEAGFPIATCVAKQDCLHWVVIYGIGHNLDRIFLAANSLPLLGKKQYSRAEFESIWEEDRVGLVCWGKPLPRNVPRNKRKALL